MTTISWEQWHSLGAAQEARFNERLLAYVEALLGNEAVTPCTFTSAEIVEAAHRMAVRIGARTEQQIARLVLILVSIDVFAVPARHAQSIGQILSDETELVDRRLSHAAQLLGIEA
jgi:hypothetical protein